MAGVTIVATQDWRSHLAALAGQGWSYLEFLTAVDWPDDGEIEVVVGLRQLGGELGVRLLSTRIDRSEPVLDSAVPVLPGAGWYEREAHEMFGVRFTGNDDLAPLLLDQLGDWPGRRTTALPARMAVRWPGLSDPADNPPAGQPPGRRRTVTAVPGNRQEWLG